MSKYRAVNNKILNTVKNNGTLTELKYKSNRIIFIASVHNHYNKNNFHHMLKSVILDDYKPDIILLETCKDRIQWTNAKDVSKKLESIVPFNDLTTTIKYGSYINSEFILADVPVTTTQFRLHTNLSYQNSWKAYYKDPKLQDKYLLEFQNEQRNIYGNDIIDTLLDNFPDPIHLHKGRELYTLDSIAHRYNALKSANHMLDFFYETWMLHVEMMLIFDRNWYMIHQLLTILNEINNDEYKYIISRC